MASYRGTAVFVADWRTVCKAIDRNQRARILFLAERLELNTKPAGRRNGQLGYIGLVILRALVLRFMNHKTGLLCPSYDNLQRATGLCRQSVATGLARLERTGLIRVTRRLVRRQVCRVSPHTGELEQIVTTTQTSSLFTVHEPGAWAPHLARPKGKRAPFPAKRQMDLLEQMALTWRNRLELSPRDRLNPHPSVAGLLKTFNSAARK